MDNSILQKIWNEIILPIIVGVVIVVVGLYIEYNYFQKRGQNSRIGEFRRALVKAIGKLGRFLYRLFVRNWKLIFGLILLFGVVAASLSFNTPLLSIGLTLGLITAIICIALHFIGTSRYFFHTIPIPVGKVANEILSNKYLEAPQKETVLNGVNFFFEPKTYIYDTSKSTHINGDGSVSAWLDLLNPIGSVKSVHVLINAGGAFKVDKESSSSLEWLKLGRITLVFTDKTEQTTELILGGNIREWAIGNFPGELIDRVDDSHCKVAWRGKNTSNKMAVIDHLEIPINEINSRKKIQNIVFARDIPWESPSSQGGKAHFFVSGVTIESRMPIEK